MKKVISSLLAMGLLLGGALSSAQTQDSKMAFSLNLGVYSNFLKGSHHDLWFSLDARYGIPVSRSLEISPEVMAMVEDSLDFYGVCFYPGVMLNMKLGDFFVGAGAVLPIYIYDGEFELDFLAPRINLGYRTGRSVLTFYALIWTKEGLDFIDSYYIGATIGYRF